MMALRRTTMLAAAVGVLGAIVIPSWTADAQSLKIRQRMAAETRDLAQDTERTNRTCETALSVSFDWSNAPEDLTSFSAESYCNAALQAIRRVCGDQIGRDAVKKRIKSVTCGFAKARTIDLNDAGTLDYKINFSSVNDTDFVYEFLQNKL